VWNVEWKMGRVRLQSMYQDNIQLIKPFTINIVVISARCLVQVI
jgi:hypothetical protein